jgi:hypothetical protein
MAAFEWPLGKLETINSALAQTGDNLVNVADDGSVEWTVCSPAYERALAAVTESHPWSWVTNFRTLQPAANAPADVRYDTAYNLPADLVHLILVRLNDRKCIWDIQNGQMIVNAQGGPPPPEPAGDAIPRDHQGHLLDEFRPCERHADGGARARAVRDGWHLPWHQEGQCGGWAHVCRGDADPGSCEVAP